MDQDSLTYDSLAGRPLPKWLTDQRDGLNTIQPVKRELKEDKSLGISITLTFIIFFLAVTVITIFILKRKKKHLP